MKQIYLLALLFFSSLLSAQNVNIPDANFKNRLLNANPSYGIAYSNGVAVRIDLNNDNEIQASEAVLNDSLNWGDVGILNLSGINDFVNLKKLDCRWNALTTLDVSGLTLLQKLNADDNQLSIVDLSSNTQLLEVSLTSNQLNSINVDNLLLLEKLYLSANNLSIIDVTTLVALQRLRIGNNSLSTLDCSQNVNLKFLSIAVNPLITVLIKNGSDEVLERAIRVITP